MRRNSDSKCIDGRRNGFFFFKLITNLFFHWKIYQENGKKYDIMINCLPQKKKIFFLVIKFRIETKRLKMMRYVGERLNQIRREYFNTKVIPYNLYS